VNQHIQPAERAHSVGDELSAICRHAAVGGDDFAAVAERLDRAFCALCVVAIVPRGDGDIRTLPWRMRWTWAAPMPRVPPVTSAVLPWSCIMYLGVKEAIGDSQRENVNRTFAVAAVAKHEDSVAVRQ